MTYPVRTMWTLSTLGRFLVPIAVFAVVFAGKSAFATCGDYLLHRDMSAASASTTESESEAAPESTPRQQCTGPHCRQAPSSPIVPASPFEWTTCSDPAVMTVPTDCNRSFSPKWQRESVLCGRIGYPEGIERPPCAG